MVPPAPPPETLILQLMPLQEPRSCRSGRVCEGARQCLSFSADAQPLELAPSEPLTNCCTFKGNPRI